MFIIHPFGDCFLYTQISYLRTNTILQIAATHQSHDIPAPVQRLATQKQFTTSADSTGYSPEGYPLELAPTMD